MSELTEVRFAVSRKVAYSAGDAVSFKSGRFVRYGTITAVYEVHPADRSRAITYAARVRCGHGTELVSIGRLSPEVTS